MQNLPFNMFGNMMQNTPFGNAANLLSQLRQFRNNFSGDPKQQVQELLNSGRMSQQQYNQISQLATQVQSFLK